MRFRDYIYIYHCLIPSLNHVYYGDGGTPQFIPLTFKTSSDARAAKIIRQFHLEEVELLAAASTQHRDPAQVHAVRPPEAGEAVLTSGPGRCTEEVT